MEAKKVVSLHVIQWLDWEWKLEKAVTLHILFFQASSYHIYDSYLNIWWFLMKYLMFTIKLPMTGFKEYLKIISPLKKIHIDLKFWDISIRHLCRVLVFSNGLLKKAAPVSAL